MIEALVSKKQEHYVYRYVLNDTQEIIYIGKTDASLKQRIDAHLTEPKFQPYLGRWRVEFIELANSVETDIIEKYLINTLKPAINEKDCVAGVTNMAIELPEWHPYSEYEELSINERATIKIEQAKKECKILLAIANANEDTIILSEIFTVPLYFRGKIIELFKKDVCATEKGYKYTLMSGVNEFVKTHLYQICADILIKATQDTHTIVDKKRSNDVDVRKEYISAIEIAQILQEFKKDKYYSDLGLCTLILPKKYWKCAENFLGIINETCEGIYIANPDMYEKINEILEHLAYCWIEQSDFSNLFYDYQKTLN